MENSNRPSAGGDVLDRLREAGRRTADAEKGYRLSLQARDELVLEADAQGRQHAAIANAAGLASRTSVINIITRRATTTVAAPSGLPVVLEHAS